GAGVVRVPFQIERMQPTAGGALDPAQLALMDNLIARAALDGLKVILDPHNYGDIYGTEIGSTPASNAAFADFWSKLAGHYASNPNVIFGVMNEPHTQSAAGWLNSANLAIAAIRQSGATTQEILVPGTAWDTAETWQSSGNAAAFASGVVDPSNNYAIEVHQYLDSDDSGTHTGVVSATIGAERLASVTSWAEATGHRLFLGEFGVSSDTVSLAALSNMLGYMQAHADVWQGGTYWAAGPWLGNYSFSLETTTGGDTAQMGVLKQFTSLSSPNPVPPKALTPIARFFDTQSGSHFMTADAQETQTLRATRPDLVYEGSSMAGLASPKDDPAAIPVARFFDTQNGMHFYTADATESAALSKPGSAFVLEQSASFYEHSTKQAGDVPVYRFFESGTGAHFFTTNQAERVSILSTRPDMVFEGIAYYAPKM
ncbi:MAG: cellulase family glycosylhydrolase, partial [Acetobacteraceae bacterium]|nr:cellulase family glycosylhydrolase [Acetobacteraceae bacterium]